MLTESSLAAAVTRRALAEGAQVVLSAPQCRVRRLASRVARRLGVDTEVVALDVTVPAELAALAGALRELGWTGVDGVVHALSYAPSQLWSEPYPVVGFAPVAQALQVGAWSLAALGGALGELLGPGSSVVGLTFDGSRAWPGHGWLAVTRAALEATARQLAAELGSRGVRVNLVASGPVRTFTGRATPGFAPLCEQWSRRAPLGWDAGDAEPVARTVVALLSDWLPATTGSVVYADGGAHAVGGR